MRGLFGIAIIWAPLLNGCIDGPGLFEQDGEAGTLAVSAVALQDQAVSGQILSAVSATQVLSGELGELQFPPGSLSIDTVVTLQKGVSISNSALTNELGLGDEAEIAPGSLAINVASSKKIDASQPFAMSLQIDQTSLFLEQNFDRLHVVYRAYRAATNSYVAGIIPRTDLIMDGRTVTFYTTLFGTFQAVFLSQDVTAAKQVDSDTEVVSKAEAGSLPQISIASIQASLSSAGEAVFSYSAGVHVLNCLLITDDDKKSPYLKKSLIERATEYRYESTTFSATAIYGKFSCVDKYGRSVGSGWSDALSLVPGAFQITGPSAAQTTNSITVSWGASSGATAYEAVIANSSACTGVVSSTTTTDRSASLSITYDGTYYVCVTASNAGGETLAGNNGFSFTADVLGPITGLTVQSAPSSGIVGQYFSSFTVTMEKYDSTPETDWSQTGALEMISWNDCASASVAGGALTSTAEDLTAVSPSSGVWTFSDVKYSQPGSGLYMRFTSGSYRVCFGPVAISLGACNLSFDNTLIEDTIGASNYPHIAACRHAPSARDVPHSDVDNNCATGWHACYPSEYDTMARAMWTDSTAISFTSNSSSWLNTEGLINEGDGTDYFANNATGDSCAAQTVGCYMRGQGPGTSSTSTGKKWTAYADGSSCGGDTVGAGITDILGYRPAGFRSIAFLCGSADGSICCRNHHTYFDCHTWDGDATACGVRSDACSYAGGSCSPL